MSGVSPKTKNMNVRVTEKEYEAIKRFASFQGKTISALVLENLLEQIEDYEDVQSAKEILSRNEKKTSWEDVQKELDLL